MIFQHTHELVMSNAKTQTRRLVKVGDYSWICGRDASRDKLIYSEILNQEGDYIYQKWQRGKTYAVQPGRGKKGLGRIRVIQMWREDVRCISDADIKAEGFHSFAEFIKVWCEMHDPHNLWRWYSGVSQESWQVFTVNDDPAKYTAWVIEFELVEQER